MPREKSRYRDKRSSSCSSESSYERKKLKSKHKRRSRSRDRSEYSESSHRRKRSTSRTRHRRRSYSRSLSKDRYESKSRRKSTSRSRSKRDRSRSSSRSRSKRDRSRSVSSSRSRSRYKSKKSKKSRSSSSRSSSYETERSRKYIDTDNKTEIEKAIKAAEAAGLTLQKPSLYESKDVEMKDDMPTIHDRNLLAEINSDSFVQKSFTSSKNKKQNIVIDLNTQTVTIPEAEVRVPKDDSIINFDELPTEEELKEMWIKKVYQFRKKIVKGEM